MCRRCQGRKIACSYVQWAPSPESSVSPPAQPQTYSLSRETVGLDLGRGRPEEILREAQFTHSLILLYFSNLGDVHFLFDEEVFLRRYALGEVSEVVLFAMMALSIRFSVAPFREDLGPSHRGEILFEHARSLLMEEFDRPSIAAAQAYVLLSTYKLAYGGSRQAFLYLGFAVNMLKVLRLLDVNAEIDPVRLECSRRLACTIALLDRFVAVPLKLAPHLSDAVPMMMTDDEFWALKRRAPGAPPRKASVNQEILRLSETLVKACKAATAGDTTVLAEVRRSLEGYWVDDQGLQYTQANLDLHRDKDTLRSFVYMHVLYHHVGQLAHFPSAPGGTPGPSPECHHHARSIAAITQHTWLHAGLDLHNVTVGQIFTLSSVVLSHALLVTPTAEDEQLRLVLRASITRVKNHTRMFNWVLQHFDEWTAKTRSLAVFDQEDLLDDILFLGSQFEKFDHRTAGQTHKFQSIGSIRMR
ncbi:hypothetical protein F5X68DRAFT_243543 [Plectosphaerella plurivora]|uniref:Xylanolytic transcriptional activator regulatory domain-containing protein n=1 Tax=Plectosphaerella plurivora TaxID=936078 RepID=A0A9P8VK88_9PEZI|nr:hypothetical protein F5X68DRAFT_243543 [Plectosphaerella plurivora]